MIPQTSARTAFLFMAAAVSFPVQAATQTVIFDPGDGYSLTVETFIQKAHPDADNGAVSELGVDSDDPRGTGADMQALLRINQIFGDGPGQIPLDAPIESATLELKVSNGGDAFALHRMLQDRDESATWSSFFDGVQADDVEALSDPVYVTDFVNRGTLQLDVTESVKQWQADPASNHRCHSIRPRDTPSRVPLDATIVSATLYLRAGHLSAGR